MFAIGASVKKKRLASKGYLNDDCTRQKKDSLAESSNVVQGLGEIKSSRCLRANCEQCGKGKSQANNRPRTQDAHRGRDKVSEPITIDNFKPLAKLVAGYELQPGKHYLIVCGPNFSH